MEILVYSPPLEGAGGGYSPHLEGAGGGLAYIIDTVGNIWRHGAIEHINSWSLDGLKKSIKNKETIPPLRRCKQCFIILPLTASQCHICGGQVEKSARELKQIEGELLKIEKEQLIIKKQEQTKERKHARTDEELVAIGTARGYKNPRYWAQCVINGRKNKTASSLRGTKQSNSSSF